MDSLPGRVAITFQCLRARPLPQVSTSDTAEAANNATITPPCVAALAANIADTEPFDTSATEAGHMLGPSARFRAASHDLARDPGERMDEAVEVAACVDH